MKTVFGIFQLGMSRLLMGLGRLSSRSALSSFCVAWFRFFGAAPVSNVEELGQTKSMYYKSLVFNAPTLAWLLVGAVVSSAVQDFV
jgi:hypothetical protein